MLNCAIIMGRLTADPELRTTGNGISVTSFSVAVDRNYQRQGQERQTDFINVVAWRQTAEFVSRYFRRPATTKTATETNGPLSRSSRTTSASVVPRLRPVLPPLPPATT